ncbi:MAG: hypothetical protein HZB51_34285 [Chloroflexi bacterium]|nr:hypothetical protein [Chloroflexota bacterium]
MNAKLSFRPVHLKSGKHIGFIAETKPNHWMGFDLRKKPIPQFKASACTKDAGRAVRAAISPKPSKPASTKPNRKGIHKQPCQHPESQIQVVDYKTLNRKCYACGKEMPKLPQSQCDHPIPMQAKGRYTGETTCQKCGKILKKETIAAETKKEIAEIKLAAKSTNETAKPLYQSATQSQATAQVQ